MIGLVRNMGSIPHDVALITMRGNGLARPMQRFAYPVTPQSPAPSNRNGLRTGERQIGPPPGEKPRPAH